MRTRTQGKQEMRGHKPLSLSLSLSTQAPSPLSSPTPVVEAEDGVLLDADRLAPALDLVHVRYDADTRTASPGSP